MMSLFLFCCIIHLSSSLDFDLEQSWTHPTFPLKFSYAVGENHVKSHFPSASTVAVAVNHEWKRLKEDSVGHNFEVVGCMPYSHESVAKISLLRRDLRNAHITMVKSPTDDTCLVVHSNYVSIMQAAKYFAFLAPVPSVLKMDPSLQLILDHYNENLPQAHDIAIVKQISEGKRVELNVVFSPGTERASLEQSMLGWVDRLTSQKSTPWNDFFWTSTADSSMNFHAHSNRKVGKMSRGYGNEHKSHVGAMGVDGQRRHQSWVERKRTIERWHNDGILASRCGWESGLNATFRRGHVLVALPDQLMDNIRNKPSSPPRGTNTDKDDTVEQAACLALLAAVVATDPLVARFAVSQPLRTQNDFARRIVQTAQTAINEEPYSNAGLTGTGIIIGIADTGIDVNHCFFRDAVNGMVKTGSTDDHYFDLSIRKVVQYINFSASSGDFYSGHGTHVAGTLAGYCLPTDTNDNTQATSYHGMAPDAKLAFFDIGVTQPAGVLIVPTDLSTDMFPAADAAGARIHSNSWGGASWFDAYSVETDAYLYAHPEMTIFFAAGNEGGYGRFTILSPGLAKNVVTVAASESNHQGTQDITAIAYFSSSGPAPDGRIKPDITAPGYFTFSSLSGGEPSPETCATTTKSGTSMATPAAAGNAALVLEYFSKSQYWASWCNASYPYCAQGAFEPPGPLLKALVLHSGGRC